MAIRALITAFLASALTACAAGVPQPLAEPPRLVPSPPPATSAVDHTVTVVWQLADSFDALPDGSCRGPSDLDDMGAGLHAQLRGRTTGLTDETRATARVEAHSYGKSSRGDDGMYCVVQMVFAPDVPDPDGYWLRLAGNRQSDVELRSLNRVLGPIFYRGEPVEPPTLPPGYGRFGTVSLLCPSLLDPPTKDCPVEVP